MLDNGKMVTVGRNYFVLVLTPWLSNHVTYIYNEDIKLELLVKISPKILVEILIAGYFI